MNTSTVGGSLGQASCVVIRRFRRFDRLTGSGIEYMLLRDQRTAVQ